MLLYIVLKVLLILTCAAKVQENKGY